MKPFDPKTLLDVPADVAKDLCVEKDELELSHLAKLIHEIGQCAAAGGPREMKRHIRWLERNLRELEQYKKRSSR